MRDDIVPLSLILTVSLLAMIGCNPDTPTESTTTTQQAGETKIPVLVSVLPQRWLVKQIGADHVRVQVMVGPGQSPATYQPTDSQINQAIHAKVYFNIGVPFEQGQWFKAITATTQLKRVHQYQNIHRLPMLEAIHDDHQPEHDHGHHHGPLDPHIWTDPQRLQQQAKTIAETLIQIDPNHANDYKNNLANTIDKLTELDTELAEKLKPYAGRRFIVFHPSWGYLADRYQLQQLPMELAGKQPTDAELAQLRTLAQRHGLSVVFVQPQINSQAAQAVAQSIPHGRVIVIDPLAEDIPANLRQVVEQLVKSFKRP